jgi:hypothetical protein
MEQTPEGVAICGHTSQAAAPVGRQVARPNYQQSQVAPRHLDVTPAVVERALLATADATDRLAAVEERDRLVMLAFAVLDDEAMLGVESVDGQRARTAVTAGIANQPREAMLPASALAEDVVAEIDDIALVTVLTHEGRLTVQKSHLAARLSAP